MNQIVFTAWVLLFPAACTTLGAAGVFLLRRRSRPCTQRILCGMAAGIMLAASVWSLLLPAIQRGQTLPLPAWIPSAVGLVLGAVGLLQVEQFAGQLLAGGTGHGGRMGAGCDIAQPARGYGGGPCRCTGIDRGTGCHQRCTGAEPWHRPAEYPGRCSSQPAAGP